MEENSMCKVISVANQKGGVAKSTTTLNLGVGLVKQGKRVLLIDADPQGSLTASLGCLTGISFAAQNQHNCSDFENTKNRKQYP